MTKLSSRLTQLRIVVIQFTHKVASLLQLWRSRLQVTQNLMTALMIVSMSLSFFLFFFCKVKNFFQWSRGLGTVLVLTENILQGIWKQRKIENPDYFEDKEPFKMTSIVSMNEKQILSISALILLTNYLYYFMIFVLFASGCCWFGALVHDPRYTVW